MNIEDVMNEAMNYRCSVAYPAVVVAYSDLRAAIEAYGAECARGERERCAKLAETLRPCQRGDCDDLAAAIRKV